MNHETRVELATRCKVVKLWGNAEEQRSPSVFGEETSFP